VIGYPIQGLFAVALGTLALSGRLTVPLLLVLLVGLSIVWDFTWTALNAAPPRIVGKDRLFLANGLLGAVSGGNQIAGFAGGAALLLVVGSPGAAMLLYGALNFAAGLAAIGVRAPSAGPTARRFLEEMREGWRYLFRTRSPPVLGLTWYSALQGFFSAAAPLVISVMTYRSFADSARSYALLFSAFAFGGIAGSLALGEIAPRRHITAALALSCAAEGLLILVGIHAAPSVVASAPAWAAVGFVDVAFYQVVSVFFQATTPTPLLGRTLANTYLFRGGARSFGALALGALLTLLAPGLLGVLLAGFFLAVALAGPAAVPALRRLAF